MKPNMFDPKNPECQHHDHTEQGECLVIELEPLCGKPGNHNNGEEDCLECLAIKKNI